MSRIVEALEKLCESNLQYNLPTEIEIFMNMDSDTDIADQYRITKAAGDIFFKELKDIIHKEDDWVFSRFIRAVFLTYWLNGVTRGG